MKTFKNTLLTKLKFERIDLHEIKAANLEFFGGAIKIELNSEHSVNDLKDFLRKLDEIEDTKQNINGFIWLRGSKWLERINIDLPLTSNHFIWQLKSMPQIPIHLIIKTKYENQKL